jgi:carbon-monoxide dehydrogenase small subunit
MTATRTVTLTVNGEPMSGEAEPRMLLSDFLRDRLGLTGTHVGCEHGVCGACTVIVNGEAARSCLMLAVQAEGARLLTIEGLAPTGDLHPLQQAFSKHHGLQCGYCTPGMMMVALDLVAATPSPTPEQIRTGMSAAICRCTGYDGIIKAVTEFAAADGHAVARRTIEGSGR